MACTRSPFMRAAFPAMLRQLGLAKKMARCFRAILRVVLRGPWAGEKRRHHRLSDRQSTGTAGHKDDPMPRTQRRLLARGHKMGTDRCLAFQAGRNRHLVPTVSGNTDSRVEVPMVCREAQKFASGAQSPKVISIPAQKPPGTAWAQSKKPPSWVASASQLTR